MKQYTITPGSHDFRPRDGFGLLPWFCLKNRALVVEVEFSESCLYEFTDALNKLPGISLNPPWKKKNQYGVMMGWRTSPDGEMIELNPYANFDFSHQIGWKHDSKEQEAATVLPGQRVVYLIWFERKNQAGVKLFLPDHGGPLQPEDRANDAAFFEWWERYPVLYTPIGLWFGGPDPAPQPMSIKINKSWEKVSTLKRRGLLPDYERKYT